MKIIKLIQQYARNRAIKKELEKNGFEADGEQSEGMMKYCWGCERHKMIPLDIFPTDSLNITPTACIGDKRRFLRETRLTTSDLEEILTAEEPVQRAYGYAGDYVFQIKVRSSPKQARQDIKKLIRTYELCYASNE